VAKVPGTNEKSDWDICVVGNLDKLTGNLMQEIESKSIPEAIFMNIFDLTKYANM
jgi:hypothetical protein